MNGAEVLWYHIKTMRTQKYSFFFLAMRVLLLVSAFVLGVYVGYANRPAMEQVTAVINK